VTKIIITFGIHDFPLTIACAGSSFVCFKRIPSSDGFVVEKIIVHLLDWIFLQQTEQKKF
jgi:hypothetical protein